jgi:hypothetical protein
MPELFTAELALALQGTWAGGRGGITRCIYNIVCHLDTGIQSNFKAARVMASWHGGASK